MLHQTFEPHDLILIAFLVVLEGVLSIDNALVLGLLAQSAEISPPAGTVVWIGGGAGFSYRRDCRGRLSASVAISKTARRPLPDLRRGQAFHLAG